MKFKRLKIDISTKAIIFFIALVLLVNITADIDWSFISNSTPYQTEEFPINAVAILMIWQSLKTIVVMVVCFSLGYLTCKKQKVKS